MTTRKIWCFIYTANVYITLGLWPPYVIGQAIYILILWFLLPSFFPRLISAVRLDVYHASTHGVALVYILNAGLKRAGAPRWKYNTQKIAKNSPSRHHPTNVSGYTFATKACIENRKKTLSSNISSTCHHNMVNVDIWWRVRGTPANFNGFRVLAALLHGRTIPVLGVNQALRRWTKGATYIQQGRHRVGHWPTF